MITLSNADAALKEYYLDAVTQELNQGVSPFFSAIEKSTQYIYGKNAKCALIKGDMNRIVTGDEDGDLPSATGNNYYDVSLPLKNIYGTVAITDKALRASQDSSGAFVNLLNAEMEGLVADAKANFARMLFGNGNGLLAYISAADSGTTFKLTSVKSWFKDLIVDIADATGTSASVMELKISSVDTQNGTVTFNKSVTNHANYVGYPVVISGAYGKELTGLSAIFDDATLYGYTKSTDDFFSPYVKTYSTLTEDVTQPCAYRIKRKKERREWNRKNSPSPVGSHQRSGCSSLLRQPCCCGTSCPSFPPPPGPSPMWSSPSRV